MSSSQSEVSPVWSASLSDSLSAPGGVSPAPPVQCGRGSLIMLLSSQQEYIIAAVVHIKAFILLIVPLL